MNHSSSRNEQAATARRDVAAGLTLLVGSVTYLVSLPRNLGDADEALILSEALRILHGGVFYTDIYEIITPGSQYLIAGLFGLFGSDLGVARAAAAVLQGLIVVTIFVICRTVGVQRPIACVTAAAQVAVCHPAWPYTSPHWLTTQLTLLLLLVAIRRPNRPPAAALMGLLTGVAIMVQQQRGVVLGVCVASIVVVDHFLRRGEGSRDLRGQLLGQGERAALGAAVVSVPAFVFLTARAGPDAILRALVHHPLTNYAKANEATWGSVSYLTGHLLPYTFPTLLIYLPMVLLPVFAAVAISHARGMGESAQVSAAIFITGVFSLLSIAYRPDVVHLAFIAPVFFVAMAWLASRALARSDSLLDHKPQIVSTGGADERAPRGRLRRLAVPSAAWAVSLAFLAGTAVHLGQNWQRAWSDYVFPRQTAFGRVDFRDLRKLWLIDRVSPLIEDTPTRELFCYPGCPALYLITGAKNPMPYQLFRSDYNDNDQVDQVLQILEQRRVPLIVTLPAFLIGIDRVVQYINDHYQPVDPSEDPPTLFRRVEQPGTSRLN